MVDCEKWEAFFYLILQLMKLVTKSLLWSPNESMVIGGSFLNHDIADPFKVAEKALHIISSEYPWSNIKFLYDSK